MSSGTNTRADVTWVVSGPQVLTWLDERCLAIERSLLQPGINSQRRIGLLANRAALRRTRDYLLSHRIHTENPL